MACLTRGEWNCSEQTSVAEGLRWRKRWYRRSGWSGWCCLGVLQRVLAGLLRCYGDRLWNRAGRSKRGTMTSSKLEFVHFYKKTRNRDFELFWANFGVLLGFKGPAPAPMTAGYQSVSPITTTPRKAHKCMILSRQRGLPRTRECVMSNSKGLPHNLYRAL